MSSVGTRGLSLQKCAVVSSERNDINAVVGTDRCLITVVSLFRPEHVHETLEVLPVHPEGCLQRHPLVQLCSVPIGDHFANIEVTWKNVPGTVQHVIGQYSLLGQQLV